MSKKNNTEKQKVKNLSKLPLAVFVMLLTGFDDIKRKNSNKEKLDRILLAFYSESGVKNEVVLKNVSDDLYKNTGAYLEYQSDNNRYLDIYNHINEYNFDILLKFFNLWGFPCNIDKVSTIEDIKECYKIMIENRLDTPQVKFENDFCWNIAKPFLQNIDNNQNSSLQNGYINVFDKDDKEIYKIWKQMINEETETIYLSGNTLKDILSNDSNDFDKTILDDLFNNKKIKTINIFLLTYLLFNKNQRYVTDKIEQTIKNIFSKIDELDCTQCPNVNIVLLSTLDIDFCLLTDNKLLKQPSLLLTKNREYKCDYCLYSNTNTNYIIYKKYFDDLLANAYDIDLYSKKESRFDIKNRLKESLKLCQYVSLKKIHPVQLQNISNSSFLTLRNKNTTNFAQYLSLDNIQQNVILPYLQETENLLEKVVKQHDRNGWAKIIPSPDLGFPKNVNRIAGGFLNGALYDWSCNVPIVPIDAMVNNCTLSIFKFKDFDYNIIGQNFYHTINYEAQKLTTDAGYPFDYKYCGDFIIIAKDDYDQYYLVLHSSAKQFKNSCFGVYPNNNSWFNENIKTEYNNEQTRYIRYIRGDAAVKFYDYTKQMRAFNDESHLFVAQTIAKLCGTEICNNKTIIKHPYEMPTSSSIAIGTFVENVYTPNNIIPNISDYGKYICLYELSCKQNNTYTLSGTNEEVVLIPYGWGQVIDGIKSIKLDNVALENERKLILNLNDNNVSFNVALSNKIPLKQIHVRHFDDAKDFINNKYKHLNGTIKSTLRPVFCYCEGSLLDKNNPFFKTINNGE